MVVARWQSAFHLVTGLLEKRLLEQAPLKRRRIGGLAMRAMRAGHPKGSRTWTVATASLPAGPPAWPNRAIRLRLVGVGCSISVLREPVTWGNADDACVATWTCPVKTQTYRWFGVADGNDIGFASPKARLRACRGTNEAGPTPRIAESALVASRLLPLSPNSSFRRPAP